VPELRDKPIPFKQLLFSNDGNTLVAVAQGTAYVLDAFNGDLKHAIRLGVDNAQQVGAAFAEGCGGWGAAGLHGGGLG